MGVNKVLVRALTEKTAKSERDTRERLRVLRIERFASDVFD